MRRTLHTRHGQVTVERHPKSTSGVLVYDGRRFRLEQRGPIFTVLAGSRTAIDTFRHYGDRASAERHAAHIVIDYVEAHR